MHTSSIINNLGLENTIPGNSKFLITKKLFHGQTHSLVTWEFVILQHRQLQAETRYK